MNRPLLLGLGLLSLSLLSLPVRAESVSPELAATIAPVKPLEASTDLRKDQWDDWEESVDDEWMDRRDRDEDRDRDRDRDRFEDDDFFNGVDDRRGRDRNDVRDDYYRNDRRDRDDDWRYDDDRDDDYWRDDNDRDDGYWRYDDDRENRVRICRNGVCRGSEVRDDRDWLDDDGLSDRDFEYRLNDNTNNELVPFILDILQQL